MNMLKEPTSYENIVDSATEETTNTKLLWTNPDGIEIDLNNQTAFQKELETEKLRYRLRLQNRFIAETEIYKNTSLMQQSGYVPLMQKLKDRAKQKETSLATELNFTIYKHMEAYKGKLKKIKNKLDADSITARYSNKIWWHKTTAYDMSTEEGAIAYVNRRAVNHIGGTHTPERLKARLMQLKQEVIPKLENNGYSEIANKLSLYIMELIAILDTGSIPAALCTGRKRPVLIKQVRNKSYDISDKYAFGTYLSFSHRDLLIQNPGITEDEARIMLCNKVLAELQNDLVNPTTTTAIKILESIIDSPTEFYNFIHAKRLASIRSAEKRKLNNK